MCTRTDHLLSQVKTVLLASWVGMPEDNSKQAWNERTGSGINIVKDIVENTVFGEKDLVKEHCSRHPHCVPCFVNVLCV